jgi:AspT/YidE/YbjL antiporter-like protein
VALKLGLAGGPLIMALILGRIGSVGKLYWFMPPSANLALRELGIVLFLAVVGLKSGGDFIATLTHGDGLSWMCYGIFITAIPLLTVGILARLFAKMNYLTLCGMLAGSMTDPPALAFANMPPACHATTLCSMSIIAYHAAATAGGDELAFPGGCAADGSPPGNHWYYGTSRNN